MHRRLVRWLPAVIAPVVVAGVVAVPLVAAAAPPDLPAKTPQQVLELVGKARSIDGFTGEIAQTSNLGLPELPSTGTGGDDTASSSLDLLTGTHRIQVWADGATSSRVAILDSRAERDLYRSGDSVWLWDSKKNTAVHVVGAGGRSETSGTAQTPAQLAEGLLAKIDPSTTVSVDTAQRVAGRDAYTLVMTPRTSATTVGHVDVAVDARTGLPLSVSVTARGATAPAFSTAFTSIAYGAQPASTLAFTPPSGATVTTKQAERPDHTSAGLGDAQKPTVSGTGWASIVTVPKADVPADAASNANVRNLTTAVAGGRLLHTALVNVLLTDDGRVLAGAVPADALTAAAG